MKIHAIFTTVATLLLACVCMRSLHIKDGGGQYQASPDGLYRAQATSFRNLNPLAAASERSYYEFAIDRCNGLLLKQQVVKVTDDKASSEYFRSLPKIITWSPDSKEVTFSIPGLTLKMEVRDPSAEPQR